MFELQIFTELEEKLEFKEALEAIIAHKVKFIHESNDVVFKGIEAMDEKRKREKENIKGLKEIFFSFDAKEDLEYSDFLKLKKKITTLL